MDLGVDPQRNSDQEYLNMSAVTYILHRAEKRINFSSDDISVVRICALFKVSENLIYIL